MLAEYGVKDGLADHGRLTNDYVPRRLINRSPTVHRARAVLCPTTARRVAFSMLFAHSLHALPRSSQNCLSTEKLQLQTRLSAVVSDFCGLRLETVPAVQLRSKENEPRGALVLRSNVPFYTFGSNWGKCT